MAFYPALDCVGSAWVPKHRRVGGFDWTGKKGWGTGWRFWWATRGATRVDSNVSDWRRACVGSVRLTGPMKGAHGVQFGGCWG